MDTTKIYVDCTVMDVDPANQCYILKTRENGDLYEVPFGLVEMVDGQEVAITENTYLRIFLQSEDDYNTEKEEEITEPNAEEVGSIKEWLDAPTKLLIHLYKEKKKLVEDRKLKTMKQMWELIKNDINSKGYSFTSIQCENKWKSLERAFKNKLNNNNKTGRGRRNCAYEKELADILVKRTSILPPVVMTATTVTHKEDLLHNAHLDCFAVEQEESIAGQSPITPVSVGPTDGCVTPSTSTAQTHIGSKKRKRQSETIKELTKLREVIENRNELKKVSHEKTIEQREQIINELRRKNDLLEQFLGRFSAS